MKKVVILLCSVLLLLCKIQGQEMPDIIAPSPQASEMTKYIDYPMDLSSGLPSISVPIYNISTQNLSFPISISYHASGLKPNESENGVVGLGWSLNAFGVVNRSLNKQADEKNYDVLIQSADEITGTDNSVLDPDPDASILYNVATNSPLQGDMSPDIFSYTSPGSLGGKFVFKRNATLSEFLKPVLLPYKPVSIVPDGVPGNRLDYFDITDERGNMYRFGKSIATGQEAKEKIYDRSGSSVSTGYTAWYLTEIISANKKDTIYFEYDDITYNTKTIFQKYFPTYSKTMSRTSVDNTGDFTESVTVSPGFNDQRFNQKKLTKISFKKGHVDFVYNTLNYPDHMLDRIEVFRNGLGTPFKTIRFSQTKYHNIADRLNWYKLDEVGFYDANDVKENQYAFEYKTGVFPKVEREPSSNADNYISGNTLAVDFWGYYNGANSNQDLIPKEFSWLVLRGSSSNFEMFGSANRTPNPSFSEVGSLEKIIFPTGGERIFEYEGNIGSYGNPVGGLRVKSITNKTYGKITKRSFDYANSGISKALDADYFKSSTYIRDGGTPEGGASSTKNLSVSSGSSINIFISGKPVVYTKVVEYDGDPTINNGWIEHLFDTSILEPNPILYFRQLIIPGFSGRPSDLVPVFYDNAIVFGDVYERETNFFTTQGDIIKTVKNNYAHETAQNVKGFIASQLITAREQTADKSGYYNFYNYDIRQLKQKLASTETIDKLGGTIDPLTRAEYTYNDDLLVIEQKSKGSDGLTTISKTTYPDEVTSTSSLGYDPLTTLEYDGIKRLKNPENQADGLHRISEPVQVETYIDTNNDGIADANELLGVQRTNYNDWGDDNVLPINVQTLKSSTGSLEDRIMYHDYDDNGNLLEVSKADGTSIIYVWGYNKEYPIAQIENATYMTGEPNTVTSAQQNLIDIAVNLSNTENDRTVDTIANGSKTYVGDEGNLREALANLRSSLPNGTLMTTYTYDPLVGITSMTDPRGYTIYYKYDSFSRLKEVRDDDNNLVTDYIYNYK